LPLKLSSCFHVVLFAMLHSKQVLGQTPLDNSP